MNIVKEFSRQQKLTLPFEDYYSLTRTNRIALVYPPSNQRSEQNCHRMAKNLGVVSDSDI